MLTLVTAPFVFLRALLKDPEELAASRARRNVDQVLQLAFRVFPPRAYEPSRRQRLLALDRESSWGLKIGAGKTFATYRSSVRNRSAPPFCAQQGVSVLN